MFTLTYPLESSFEFEGHTINLDLTYDNILRMFELFDSDLFNSYEKVIYALNMLLESKLPREMEFEELFSLYKFIMKEFLEIDLDKKQDDQPKKKYMDWKKDAGLIYASFLSEYGIDLRQEQGKMHWHTFSALLQSLGDSTKFKKVVSYRAMKVPSTKEASEDYRKHILEMKELYSLEDKKEKLAGMESTLDAVASTFGGGGKK